MDDDKKTTPPKLLTRQETRRLLNCHVRTVDYYLKVGKLTRYRDGRGRVGIDPAEVEALITPVPVVASSDR